MSEKNFTSNQFNISSEVSYVSNGCIGDPRRMKAGWYTGILNCNNQPESFYISLRIPLLDTGGYRLLCRTTPKILLRRNKD